MKKILVGFDVSPLYSGHKVRGIGFYTERLLEGLKGFRDLEIRELRSKKEVDEANYDLLHIPYFHPYFFTLPFRKKGPLVVTIHDLIPVKYPEHYPPGIKGRLRWEIQRGLLQRVDLVITDSFASKSDIARLTGYPKERIHVVYLAADDVFRVIKSKRILREIKEKYRLPEKFVLYVGDVNWNKNVPGLVRACRAIGAPLVIVGKQAVRDDFDPTHPENKDLAWLKKMKERHTPYILNSKFYILTLGFIPTEDLVAIYNLATVYCQPSFDEGFGLPVIEAMACGCPVVASNRGSLPEVVGKAAILTKPEVKDLAEAVKSLLQDEKKRRGLASLGLKKANEFSWQKAAQDTYFLYKSLIAGRLRH